MIPLLFLAGCLTFCALLAFPPQAWIHWLRRNRAWDAGMATAVLDPTVDEIQAERQAAEERRSLVPAAPDTPKEGHL